MPQMDDRTLKLVNSFDDVLNQGACGTVVLIVPSTRSLRMRAYHTRQDAMAVCFIPFFILFFWVGGVMVVWRASVHAS